MTACAVVQGTFGTVYARLFLILKPAAAAIVMVAAAKDSQIKISRCSDLIICEFSVRLLADFGL
jgi:hypothetical protein